jgi:hypothetical protein
MHNVALFTVQCMRTCSCSMTTEISYVTLQANAALEQLLKAQYKDVKLVGDEIVLYDTQSYMNEQTMVKVDGLFTTSTKSILCAAKTSIDVSALA